MRDVDKEVDFMSKIGGYTSFDVGFQKNIYEKAKSENKRTDKKPVEKYGAAQKKDSKQPELSQGAKDLLNEMQKKYGDMDFFVADYSSDDEAQHSRIFQKAQAIVPCTHSELTRYEPP